MDQEPTYTLVDDRVIRGLDETLTWVRRALSRVQPASGPSEWIVEELDEALGRLGITAALAAKHAVHLSRSDLNHEQQIAAEAYFERYLAEHVRPVAPDSDTDTD